MLNACCLPAGALREFSEEEVLLATQQFDALSLLGSDASGGDDGGGGRFYSGALDDGRKVAVKVLTSDGTPPPTSMALSLSLSLRARGRGGGGGGGDAGAAGAAFAARARELGRLRHPCVASLLGWSAFWDLRFLVYEFVDGFNLRQLLRGCRVQAGQAFDWAERLRAALGAARGLAQIHACAPEDCSSVNLSHIVIDRQGCARVVDYVLWPAEAAEDAEASSPKDFSVARERQQITEKGQADLPGSAVVRALGQILLCLLVGEDFASHRIFSTTPLAPNTLDHVLKGLDPHAGWPVVIAKAVADVSLACLHLEEGRRPALPAAAARLRRLCDRCGLLAGVEGAEIAEELDVAPEPCAPCLAAASPPRQHWQGDDELRIPVGVAAPGKQATQQAPGTLGLGGDAPAPSGWSSLLACGRGAGGGADGSGASRRGGGGDEALAAAAAVRDRRRGGGKSSAAAGQGYCHWWGGEEDGEAELALIAL